MSDNSKIRSVRMTDRMWKRLRVAAEQSGVSRGRFIRIVLNEYMDTRNLGNLQGPRRGPGYVPINNLRGSDID
jgi:metal-responsive CopG/Arc/MetJ family transcriptional regulator